VDKGLVSEKDIEKAVTSARINQIDVAQVLIEDHKVPQGGDRTGPLSVLQLSVLGARGPDDARDLKERLPIDFLRKNMCAPVEKRDGTLVVAVEDPYDLTRQDAVKVMNLAPRHEFVVGLRGDILEYVKTSYGDTTPGAEEQDLGRIIMELGSGEDEEESEGGVAPTADIDEIDRGIIKLANQIIIDGYNRGPRTSTSSPTARRPYRRAPAHRRDCHKYLEIPSAHRHAIVSASRSWPSSTSPRSASPRTARSASRAHGDDRAARRHDPTAGGNEDVVMRILAASKPLPLEQMGFSDRNLRSSRTS
jgi:hypothetical protein